MTALVMAIGSGISAVASGIGGAFSSIFGGGTAAAAAPAAGAQAASTGISFGSILQGGLGLVSAMGALREGQMQAEALRSQAADTRLEITQEQLDAGDRQQGLRKQLVQALGERDTAYAASGVDLSFGTPQQARTEAIQSAQEALSIDQGNSDIRKARLRAKAFGYEAQASDVQSAAGIRAFGAGIGALSNIFTRG